MDRQYHMRTLCDLYLTDTDHNVVRRLLATDNYRGAALYLAKETKCPPNTEDHMIRELQEVYYAPLEIHDEDMMPVFYPYLGK